MGLHELEVGRLRLDSDKAIGDRTHPGQGRDRIDSRTAPLGSSSMRVNWSWRAATASITSIHSKYCSLKGGSPVVTNLRAVFWGEPAQIESRVFTPRKLTANPASTSPF